MGVQVIRVMDINLPVAILQTHGDFTVSSHRNDCYNCDSSVCENSKPEMYAVFYYCEDGVVNPAYQRVEPESEKCQLGR